jgi:phosphohistidine swiveling domain-containing protein
MKKISKNEVIKKIKILGLKPSIRRDLSIQTMSSLSQAYMVKMKDFFGFGYNALGAFGKGATLYSLVNEDDLRKKLNRYLKKSTESDIENILVKAFFLYKKNKSDLNIVKKYLHNKDFFKALSLLYDFSINVHSAIAVYNCFFRFFRDENDIFSEKLVKRMGQERNEVAKQYVLFETLFNKSTSGLSVKNKFNGEALRYLIRSELFQYLNGKLSREEVDVIYNQRKQKYLFIHDGKQERVFYESQLLDKVQNYLWPKINVKKSLKGVSIYPGHIKARVYSVDEKNSYKIPSYNYVIVASMTHPNLFNLIKKSVGLVTDEGGILCHAAIIARELKKPCVIATKLATKIFKDGDTIEVDADKGIVRKII